MKNQQHYPRHRAATPFARTALAAALTVAMPILAMQTASAQPALVADPSAANRPGLGVASNGTPIVDINAPNAAGISTNRFLDYNVGSSGLVLNNSVGRTNTQLAGSIDGNAQLGGRSAQVILNQVTGGNASMLAGATEVAGQNARVIVANPNGISVNGASFINANRVSLVAGTVELDQNGGITQFRTKDGHIAIDGDGLDASSQDRLDLVSRTLKVNAAVQAKKLVAVAQEGVAAIEHSNLEIFKASPDSGAVDVAIDVSKLGSMHADSIMMRGASAGVGVNVAGKVEALTGEIKLMSDGKIQVSADGRLAAAGELHADGKLQNAGTIAGSKLTLMKGVANTGTLRADGKILAMADVNNSGSIYGGNGVDIVGNLHQEAPGVVGANGKVSVLGKTTGSGTIDENMTKPPVNLEPPVAETKPPVNPEPPVAETNPPVNPEPPVAETNPPVNPEPPVAETNPPVNPEPPVAETKPPVDPEPPVAETKPPVDPEPPVAETNPPVNPEPPVAETKPPVDPEPPVAETKPQLVVDPNAADRPVVKSAANGTPIVDIAEANSAGISHNRFLDYNVGAAGLVLNNSVAGAHTQLAGDIGGNALLNGRSASIILNQVTGGNASVLAGTTEVAGQSARVIVANPNGISVNGGSFVNANRVSLVAGATEFDGQGNIARFRTDDGRIAIEGAGLDAYGMDQLDLVSRGLKVDGAVHGNKLVAVAQQGTAAIEGAKPQIVSGPANGVTPDVAIDVSESGSLHADAVTLVGTSAKTGVRIAGTVDAPAGSLSLASSGTARIERSGRVQADTLAIQGGLDNDGTVSGNTVDVAGNLGNGGSIRGGDVRLSGDVDNRGEIGGERALEVMGSLNNDGTVRGGDVKVAGNVVNQGSVTSGGALDIMGHLTNNGAASLVDGRDVQVTGDVVNEGTVNGDGALKVNGSLNNDGAVRGGSIKVMGNAVNRGSVTSDGVLGIMGHLTNSGAGSVVDGRDVQVMGNVVNQGAVNSDGTLKFVGSLTNNGTVRGGDVQVTGNTTNNGELRGEHTVFTTGNVTNRGMLHGGNSVFVMGRLYNGLFGVTSSYGKVSSMVRMSGPGRVVSNMARP
ncbi:filamentous hemagglutinin N-terminal domain-containing protein [Burkholderia stagnalis]|uniref:two-partner secretion domain-containing protein n=2 Tax=Burkholderia stagnalis TaxID=1503054 RepID=UPI000F58C562|nr:filamentous hemagglutinin N-terminal domain-containing protein [Burkholderia stagnalis]RQQ05671.1 filamentous hemagglutinin N-terminal domain-containing protein [Burkholderia stagnalis]RQQ20067.1 filamentous hemagglutinin N-terminal domain-containing protein [Burkholderia stagnalis]RQQ37291.1 filamentous hemagglutinin N-terminal domain-containing protein [Burkholderia stagnalis]RQQ37967.1 filamentous hemagglutinin N-terminal domain-containing protein [Burkholderia stagnalis]RQQ39150.1 filam